MERNIKDILFYKDDLKYKVNLNIYKISIKMCSRSKKRERSFVKEKIPPYLYKDEA